MWLSISNGGLEPAFIFSLISSSYVGSSFACLTSSLKYFLKMIGPERNHHVILGMGSMKTVNRTPFNRFPR